MQSLIETEMRETIVTLGQNYFIPDVILATLAKCSISQVRSILSSPVSCIPNRTVDSPNLDDSTKMEHAIDVLYRDAPEIRELLFDILDFYVKRYVPLSDNRDD